MKIDTKKVHSFLKGLSKVEYNYLSSIMGIRESIEGLIMKFKLSKEDVCAKFGLEPNYQYDEFLSGKNYDLMEIAKINAWFMELEMEALKDKAPIQVATGDYKYSNRENNG